MRDKVKGTELVFLVVIIGVFGLAGFTGNFNMGNSPPTVTISDTFGKIWTVTNLTAIAIDNNILRFEWDFGDGSYENVSRWEKDKINFLEENISCTVSHKYEKGGVYRVMVKVIDREGLSCTADANVTIYPIVDAGKDQIVHVGETVFFSGKCEVLDGTIVEYFWSFDENMGLFDICMNGRDKMFTEWVDIELPSGHLLTIGWFNTTWRYEHIENVTAVFEVHTTCGTGVDTCIITILPGENNTSNNSVKERTSTNRGRTASADYVDASNNTNCIEEDPLVPGWSKDVRLSDADGKDSLYPSIDRSSSNIYIVWQDDVSEEYWGIYFRKSTNYGVTWENKKLVVTNGEHPCIATDENGGIHLVYYKWIGGNCEIFYMKSVDGGAIWSSETRLTNFEGHSTGPIIGIYQSIIHLIWCDQRDGNMEVYYKKSIDLGDTWDEEDIRLTNAPDVSWPQSLAIDSNGDVHIVWNDKRDGNVQVYYKRVTNGEESLSEDVRLTKDPAESREPTLCIDSHDNVHVAWADYRSQKVREDIFYKSSTDGGNTWSDDINITKQSYADSFMPNIIADLNNNLHLIWKTSNRSDNSNDFYYKKISNTIDILSSPTIRLTNAVYGGRMWPKMIMDEKNLLHVVWYDQREDDNQTLEVYYKRTLNPVTEPPIIVASSLNLTTCKPGNSITVSGNAVYNDTIVPNANVSIKILETGNEWNITTDSNGDYSKTITTPNTPGNYTVRVTVTSGNHTGWKQMRLTVEEENTNGGTTNGDTTNGGQSNGEENKQKFDFNYVLTIVGVIAGCVIIGVVLVKRRGKSAAKTEKEKTEKTTMGLRCPKCKKTFRVEVKPKPFSVKCPFCGKEGVIK